MAFRSLMQSKFENYIILFAFIIAKNVLKFNYNLNFKVNGQALLIFAGSYFLN